jgi:mannose-6-phosphate isomerase-like protein (cupin superfamily)
LTDEKSPEVGDVNTQFVPYILFMTIYRRYIAIVSERSEHMATIISKEQLQNGNLFQGDAYGGVPISFFWMQLPPDEGPKLHFHPYDEIFIILEGRDTFTVGDQTIEVEGGNIVIGPANVPHKFTSSGEGTLRAITIHPSPHTIGTRVEE